MDVIQFFDDWGWLFLEILILFRGNLLIDVGNFERRQVRESVFRRCVFLFVDFGVFILLNNGGKRGVIIAVFVLRSYV